MTTPYADVLRRPGARRFVVAGFVGRLPISMIALGVVLLATSHGADYATAGALAAVFALSAAAISPLGARWVDRRGQARVVPVLLAIEVVALAAFVAAAQTGAPAAVAALLLALAGAASPNIGSLVRARWAALLSGESALRAAFAIEGIVDEMVFVVGPPLVTAVALGFSPAAALGLCVALLLVGGLWLAAQRATQPPPRPPAARGSARPYWSSAYALMVVAMAAMGAVFGSFEVTTVAFTRDLGHESMTGVILALYAAGSLVAGLVYGARHPTWPLPRQFLLGAVVLVAVCVPMPLAGSLPWLAAAATLAGMAVSPLLILTVAIVEQLVPAPRLTEALTVATSGLAVGLAIGSPTAGWLIDSAQAAAGYLVMVGGAAVTAVVAIVGVTTLRSRLDGPGGSAG